MHTWPFKTFLAWFIWLACLHGLRGSIFVYFFIFIFIFIFSFSFSFMIVNHSFFHLFVIFLFILFSLIYLFINCLTFFLICLLIRLFIQLFTSKNFTLLQGNLPLEFKEGGTLLGRFWRGIRNWEDCFWRGRLKKKEKKKRRRERGEFSFREQI